MFQSNTMLFFANSHFSHHKSIIYGHWWKIHQLEINWNYPWRLPDLMGCCRNTNRVWSAEQGLECNCKHEQWTPRAGKRKHLYGGGSVCVQLTIIFLEWLRLCVCYHLSHGYSVMGSNRNLKRLSALQQPPTAQFSISALLWPTFIILKVFKK